MRRPNVATVALLLLPVAALARHHDDEFSPPPTFQLEGPAIGGVAPADPTPAYLTTSRIAAVGEGALAIDADSGLLFRTDADGAATGRLAIGKDAGLLAYDPIARRAFVADRRGDRLVVVSVGETLEEVAHWKTPVEPYAVALTPDRARVLVATIADRYLVAYDAATGAEAWRVALASEPRGLAIAPDGKHALVSYLATSFVDEVTLDGKVPLRRALPAFDRHHARGAFAATFLGAHLAAVSFEREAPAPDPNSGEFSGHYGGSILPPITHHIAFLGERGAQVGAATEIHEPRALAWQPATDTLYLAGLGTDAVVRVTRASQLDPDSNRIALPGKERCGADGLAATSDGVLVWCSFTRSVARVAKGKATRGPELAASTLTAELHIGMVLFHTADENVSQFGGVACGNCHLDGRADGMSWLINGRVLQTPMLAGRLVGTAPFKWDGGAKDLPTSLVHTVARLGGSGLSKAHIAALAGYLESMPAVRTPTRSPGAVTRGQALFESASLGCASCHDGDVYTDRQLHTLGRDPASDTPSLVGLAASAPYFHDGSAATLEVLLRERGSVHGMADASRKLTDLEIADLVAFLETR